MALTPRTLAMIMLVLRTGPLRRWLLARARSRATDRARARLAPRLRATWEALPPAWMAALEDAGLRPPAALLESPPSRRELRPVLLTLLGVAAFGVAVLGVAALVRSRRAGRRPARPGGGRRRIAIPVGPSRAGARPEQGSEAAEAVASTIVAGRDELRAIRGIGPATAERLRQAGIGTIDQVAGWSPDDVVRVAGLIGLSAERIEHEDWVGQARTLVGKTAPAD